MSRRFPVREMRKKIGKMTTFSPTLTCTEFRIENDHDVDHR